MIAQIIFACFLFVCHAGPRRLLQTTTEEPDMNVYEEPLRKCSRHGEATTGYKRTGSCDDVKGDIGTHHICVDLHTEPNFCHTTNQGDWCDELQATRNEETGEVEMLERKHWCICQWAFEGFLKRLVEDHETTEAEACARFQVDCGATNDKAREAYKNVLEHTADPATRADAHRALNCLKSKCNNFQEPSQQLADLISSFEF